MAKALLGLIALQEKAVTSDSIREQECEASSLLLFFLRSRAPPASLAATTNNNEELKKPGFPLAAALHTRVWGPCVCTHPHTDGDTRTEQPLKKGPRGSSSPADPQAMGA